MVRRNLAPHPVTHPHELLGLRRQRGGAADGELQAPAQGRTDLRMNVRKGK